MPIRLDRGPFQPSMTEDSAIRIDLHSAEVVHFHHKIRMVCRGSTTDCTETACTHQTADPNFHYVSASIRISSSSGFVLPGTE